MNNSDASSDQANTARIETLLQQASQLPAGERDVFLTRECGNDASLRQAVYERLLAESRGVKVKLQARTGPVTSAVRQALAGSAHDRQVELLGKVVGDYRLVAIVGIGGAGTVYLGERADRAYSAQVAIKVVANTQLSHEIQRRFFAERQILANLNHPYIGRLLDAGETFFDEPFLVMEYVHGEPIDRYCDNQRLNIEERITLFLKICEAVQYAHRNLIVHRDLKPGNILVSKEGIPKLLDFGIAKLLDESAQAILHDGSVAHTRVHDRLLTPEYASPEQIRGQPVTTTSDVYALGIVLYELLTGTRPYAVNALSQLELERSICIQDPHKPSQMLTSLSKHVTQPHPTLGDINLIPTARKTSFKKLKQTLEGDLDAILMKALRKEPEKRYSSVEHLMDDLNRHLDQEPVEARQGNRWYYTQRFIKRHTIGVIAGTTALLALIAVAIILSIQAHQLKEQRDIDKQERDIANHERDRALVENSRADSVAKFMEEVLIAADPYQSQKNDKGVQQLLDRAAQRIDSDRTEKPEVRAQLLFAIGQAYLNQNHAELSIKYLEEALHLQNTLPLQDYIKLAITFNRLGGAYEEMGLLTKSKQSLSESNRLFTNLKDTNSKDYLQLLIDRCGIELRMGNLLTAESTCQQGLKLAHQLYNKDNVDTASLLTQLAEIMVWQSRLPEAEQYARRSAAIFHSLLPEKHPDRIDADLSLADVLSARGKFTEATALYKQGLDESIAVYGNDNSRLVSTYDALAQTQLALRHWESAEHSAKMELSIAKKNFGDMNFNTGVAHTVLGHVFLARGKSIEAEKEARLSLKILQATAPPDHQYTASAEYLLASALVGEHKIKEAEPMIRENIARWGRAKAPAWRAARSESLLGIALLQLHKPDEVKQHLLRADAILSAKDSGAFPNDIANVHKRVEEFQSCENEHRLNQCELSI